MSSVELVMMAARSPLRWLRNAGGPLPEGERNSALWELRAAPGGGQAPLFCLTRERDHQP